MFFADFGQKWKVAYHIPLLTVLLKFCPISVEFIKYSFKIQRCFGIDSDRFTWCKTYSLMSLLLISTYGFSEKLPTSWTMSARHFESFSVQLLACCASLDWTYIERIQTGLCASNPKCWNNTAILICDRSIYHTFVACIHNYKCADATQAQSCAACHSGASTASMNLHASFPHVLSMDR